MGTFTKAMLVQLSGNIGHGNVLIQVYFSLQSGIRTDFPRSISDFPLLISFDQCSSILLVMMFSTGKTGKVGVPCNKSDALLKIGEHQGRIILSIYLSKT
jgi:hypothetical protein